MSRTGIILALTLGCLSFGMLHAQSVPLTSKYKILLVAGETAKVDKMGHHDYLAGNACLKVLLSQTPNVETVQVAEGWPEEEKIFDGVNSVVFYTDGGGKQAFLNSPERVAKVQKLVESGVGLVMIHQAVDFPAEFAEEAKSWIGGVYLHGRSGRGHWDSNHVDFPQHPITSGVQPWQINDGWLNDLVFVESMRGITPLVWSGKEYAGSRAGLDKDIVAWAYERPDGGRSFSFTGLDAHSAWSLPGMRQLIVNGILWTAGVAVPADGAACEIDETDLEGMQTPREPKAPVVQK
jgi:type 1 glutamine amidotransferase